MWENEELSVEESVENAQTLSGNRSLQAIQFGSLLSKQKRFKMYVSRGYKTFKEFVECEYNMSSGEANKRISLHGLFIECLDIDEKRFIDIGFDKLCMIKSFCSHAKIAEALKWVDMAEEMNIAVLREHIKEIREEEKQKRKTMKDVMTEQFWENATECFNCSKKELEFKFALYFQGADYEGIRNIVRERQIAFESKQLKAQEEDTTA